MKRFAGRTWRAWAVCGVLMPLASAQLLLKETKVDGAEQFQPSAILAAAGIATGQTLTKNDLDAAARRLSDTGMFTSVTWRCEETAVSEPGCALTFQVREAPRKLPVRIDIPGVDGREFWKEVTAGSLLRERVPGNEPATAYCVRVTEDFLRKRSRSEPVAARMWADIHTGATALLVRLASPPKVTAVRFTGNQAIATSRLQAAAGRLAIGRDFSENDIRAIVESNARPLYQKMGRLGMLILSVTMQESAAGAREAIATIEIDEGPEWKLGNGVLCQAGIMTREGGATLEARIEAGRGRPAVFGALKLVGLGDQEQAAATKLWTLPPGAPLSGAALPGYDRAVSAALGGRQRLVRQELRRSVGSGAVDVILTFK